MAIYDTTYSCDIIIWSKTDKRHYVGNTNRICTTEIAPSVGVDTRENVSFDCSPSKVITLKRNGKLYKAVLRDFKQDTIIGFVKALCKANEAAWKKFYVKEVVE